MIFIKIGLDVGSTTIKYVALDDNNYIVCRSYERHFSKIEEKIAEILKFLNKEILHGQSAQIAMSGSAGMGFAEGLEVDFVQEVFATKVAVESSLGPVDVVIELGGEDAKILFLSGGTEVRMNGTCAGGTGAFLDQMATLMNVPVENLDSLAAMHKKIYPIASRCGVFAKSDVQPLLNQGASTGDLAASIMEAVVAQTVAGLAQGRKIEGRVVYLGGPLTFMPSLRIFFDNALGVQGICPKDSLYFVALGAALSAEKIIKISEIEAKLQKNFHKKFSHSEPLFKDQFEYEAFLTRHSSSGAAPVASLPGLSEDLFLGIDAGSTTVKAAIINENDEILDSFYINNTGNLIADLQAFLLKFFQKHPESKISAGCATGYGEGLVKAAFGLDFGIVETVAHLKAAQKLQPDVDFVLDIGGQDIKCFRVAAKQVEDIFLNEACSAGCGSFLQAFAKALGYTSDKFAKMALLAKRPVDLGSRCTVFMNSAVKQAQKDGAQIEDIAAGLATSVVKNALYKVIRVAGAQALGKKIVVQGGTFLNDAVLRAFEREIGTEVIRPKIAGLMGAFGAALFAKENRKKAEAILDFVAVSDIKFQTALTKCATCTNKCPLVVYDFSNGSRFVSGSRCDRFDGEALRNFDDLNIYVQKLEMLKAYGSKNGIFEKIGLPLALNMFELLPFWHTFFTKLGFGVEVSPLSTQKTYLRARSSVPSDTVCYPAKLVHGHVEALLESKVGRIFYPCMSYNLDEGGDNHYNCPVVAYYPEVLRANMSGLSDKNFIYGYVGLHNRAEFPRKIYKILSKNFKFLHFSDVKKAADAAYKEYFGYLARVKTAGEKIIFQARAKGSPIILLAGRPYHLDPEVNHGIDRLIGRLGAAVLSEESCPKAGKPNDELSILNQWTYHSRLYGAAHFAGENPDVNLVQLVSFGCGCDAVTSDEVRQILQKRGKIYTQFKIDEVSNLDAVKIRLRSLFAAL